MLKGVVGLVTGGASGLGRATVERLIREGGKAVVADLPSSQGKEFADKLGPNALFAPVDVTSESDVEAALKACKKEFGGLHVTVNCAGIAIACRTYNNKKNVLHKLDDFEKILMVNVVGTFNVTCQSVRMMYENDPDDDGGRGVVINTSSIAAFEGQIGQVAYAASKGAIASMTIPLARDLSLMGIRVNTIAPGLFQTPMVAGLPEKVHAFLSQNVPFPQRFGNPDEYAHMVESIIKNPYMNGETIRLDAALRMMP